MHTVVAFEHESLPVRNTDGPEDARCLTEAQWRELLILQDRLPRGAVEVRHRAVRFGSFCGVLQVAGGTLEILPKIERHEEDPGANRQFLLHMLAACQALPLTQHDIAHVRARADHLLHIFVDAFCRSVFQLVHQGLIHQYIPQRENLSVVRGRIDWAQQLRQNLVHKERMYCEYEEFVVDNPYNRVLKAAVLVGKQATRSNLALQRKLRELEFIFDPVALARMKASDVDRLPRNRLVKRYDAALTWARWLLSNENPELQGGFAQATDVLFDMNVLFQEFIYRKLQRLGYRSEFSSLRVFSERPMRAFLTEEANDSTRGGEWFQMKPDLLVFRAAETTPLLILDTKWKLLSTRGDGNKWGVSQADVYQMFAYAKTYGCADIVLLYPEHKGVEGEKMPDFEFNERFRVGHGTRLHVRSIDVRRPDVEEQLGEVVRPFVVVPKRNLLN